MKQELQPALKKSFNELLSILGSLDEKQINAVPFEGSWTAAQVAEHLSRSYEIIEALKVQAATTERPADEKVETLKAMFLNRDVKMKSPAFILPSEKPINRELLIKDLTIKTNNIIQFLNTEDLSLSCPAINFPGFGHLTRMEWLCFISYHTERHLYQLRNIYNLITTKNLNTMTQIVAYLNFDGRAREAMSFYQQCLGGELVLQKISESPMAAQMPSEMGPRILHSSLTKNGLTIMGSDMLGAKTNTGNNVMLCMMCSSDEEVNSFFSALAAGGKIDEPLHQSFWGATFGKITDKFGIHWMFNYSKN
ncbi:MAG: DUF1569 domain-containing protein [Bacteroidetes bacterium]|nr:MAG: DUF1569 domain-containing protein [Bacteroidota bacterium]